MRIRAHGEGPLVLKLAGVAGGTGLYREEMEAATLSGFRVGALDVAGDRRDDPLPSRPTWRFYADEVARGLDVLGAERALLWGTSFGGLVALAAAARHPDRVSGLLLAHPPEPLRLPAIHRALIRWVVSDGRSDLTARIVFSLGFYALMGWEAIFPPLVLRVPGLLRVALEAATPTTTLRLKLRMLLREEPGLPPAGRMPVTILSGAWDTVAPLSGARHLAARIPGARLRIMRVSGHSGAYARPRAYARVSVEELRSLRDRGKNRG